MTASVKVIVLVKKRPDLGIEAFSKLWIDHATTMRDGTSRPRGLSICETLVDESRAAPHYDGATIGLFDDIDSAAHFAQKWTRDSARYADDAVTDVIIADELVLRGREYLDQLRIREPGEDGVKMISGAKRADHLTLSELSARWKNEGGRMGDSAIPPDLLGKAYVQNHVLNLAGREWPYDAVNEVWFDDRETLQRRVEYFAARRAAAPSTATSIFHPTIHFDMAVSEQLI